MVGYLGSKPIVLFIDPAQDTAQAFRAAYIRLHNFSVQVSKHKAARGLTISLGRMPRSDSCLDTSRPINPVAPVTNTFCTARSLPCLLKGFESAHAAIKVKNLTGQPGTVIRQQI